jgi:hypothetical protein
MAESLADLLLAELDRNQTLIEQYHEVAKLPGVNVGFAVAGIKHDIKLAQVAMVEGDVVKMAQAYARLKGNE